MEHVKALGIKFIVISIVLFSILSSFYTATLGNILVISLLVTGVAYVVGDLFILPRLGNLIATIADLGLAFIAVWMLSELFFVADYGIVTASLFSALLIACSEAIFHLYMNRKVLQSEEEIFVKNRNTNVGNLQTEFAEEEYDRDIIELDKKREEKNKE